MKRKSTTKNYRGTVAKLSHKTPRPATTVRQMRQLGETPKGGRSQLPQLSQPPSMPPSAAALPGSLPALAGPLPGNAAACGMHPADELAAIREEIKALKSRETELREIILADPESRLGTWNAACVETGWQNRIDATLLRQNHPEIALEVTKRMQVVFVRTVQVQR